MKALPLAEVRKTLAASGLDCIGSMNELKRRLAEHVIASSGGGGGAGAGSAASGGGSGAGAGSAASGGGGGGGGNAALIKQVLEAADDYAALLSLSGAPITAASPLAEMRKAYLRLSMRVHPDKNGGSAEAKGAFQALVLALERLAQPGGAGEGGGARGAASAAPAPRQRVDTSALAPRSNAGCVQHKVLCPRCGMDWPRKELGLEDGAYNFFMSALKEYSAWPRLSGFARRLRAALAPPLPHTHTPSLPPPPLQPAAAAPAPLAA